MKDPAVLFYFQDFLVGTEFMTDDEVGKYIRILCHQADKGALSKCHVERICSGKIPDAIMEKLKRNGDGKYYQERMKLEKEKREKHIEHQRENANKRWKKDVCDGNAVALPLENINEDINEDINRDDKKKREELLKKREVIFKSEVYKFMGKYSDVMLSKFCNYWTEKNKSCTKMKFELQKTFEISKRLATWANNDKEFNKQSFSNPKMSTKYLRDEPVR